MAGFIAINQEKEFSMSSVCFDAIVNYSKPYLVALSPEIAHEIYEPIDKAGMFVVGLAETSSDDFRLIFQALKAAYENCLKQGKCGKLDPALYNDVIGMWKDILLAMENDERQENR